MDIRGIAAVLLLGPLLLAAQQLEKQPALRSATNLVHINVIVQDKAGHPVADLTQGDFIIKDRGKVQRIGLFSVVGPNLPSEPMQALPRNLFSDQPQYNGGSPNGVTIVLLDNLNSISGSAPTPYEDTPFWLEDHALAAAKQRLLSFLKQVDSNQRIAIYGLTNSVHVLCDFTCTRDQLIAVVSKYDATGMTQRETTEPGNVHTPGPGAEFDARVDADLQVMAAMNNERRAETTMAALAAIAAHVADIPGRKNLLWLTSNLPFSGEAIARILSRANIVAYPIDARGLLPRSPQGNLTGVMDADAYARGELGAPPAMAPQPIGIKAMQDMAADTGGLAFVNTNDLTGAIRQVVEESVVTYTLGFYVDAAALDGKFHKLTVQVTRPGLSVRYPKGYFAFKNEPATQNERHNNFVAAIRSPLDSAAIPLLVRAVHVDQPADSLQIAGSFGLRNLQLTEKGDTRSGTVDLYFIEQDAAGNVLQQSSTHLHLKLTDQEYRSYLQSGIFFHQQLRPKPGSSVVRVLVQDPATSEVGSVIIPLARLE
jgi:VWFA-related protein